MSDPVFKSALADAKTIDGTVDVSVIDDCGMIDLRGDLSDKKFTAAVQKALGISLPSQPRQSTNKGDVTALWLSPDQWLILCPLKKCSKLSEKLQVGLKNIHSLVVDVSDARTIIRVRGKGAREVLMKGAPVDLTDEAIKQGFVRRLQFAEVAALVHVVSTTPDTLDLFVFRSYADYVWDWLAATTSKQSELHIFQTQETAKL